ncbi:MAG: carboxymuconolactone decarboxylase family protein [Candidatus Latescibacterota bacterium]|nr:MAG: carboxymuconolactone decarboxylase family protein [Candidatus Latescibacterota bacterium]
MFKTFGGQRHSFRRGRLMDKLRQITRKRKEAHAKLTKMDSKVYRAFLEMEKAAYSDGALSKKSKELIAVGVSVTIDCESCMQWHIEQAVGSGATKEEILEAIEVGMEMGGGPAVVSSRFALDVIEDVFKE